MCVVVAVGVCAGVGNIDRHKEVNVGGGGGHAMGVRARFLPSRNVSLGRPMHMLSVYLSTV